MADLDRSMEPEQPAFRSLQQTAFSSLQHAAFLKGLLKPFKGKGELGQLAVCSGLISPDTSIGGKCIYRGVFND